MFASRRLAPREPLPDIAIHARGLRKTYGRGENAKQALKGIDLAVPRGSFFGLLGPNGAGKSTFINILAGLVVKTEGEVAVWSFDIDERPRSARSAIGVVPQELNIDAFFTPREMMEFQAGLYGVPKAQRRTDEILAAMHLTEKADSYSRSLSGGMRRRMLVGKAMAHSPPILVLDEPTAGVDVELRQQLWDYVRGLNEAGVTVVLTTHYLEEAQALCDRIAIINHGEVVACDETPALIARIDSKVMLLRLAAPLAAVPPELAGLEAKLIDPNRLSLRYRPSTTSADHLLARIREAGLELADLSTVDASLEDIFLDLTASGNGA